MRQLGTRRPTNLCNCKKGRSLARHPIRQIVTRCSENLCCGKLCIWTLSADAFWPNETTLVVRTWKSLRSTDHPRIFKDSTSFFLALDQPTPPDREVLTGLAERVTYQNAENGFCVVRIKARGQRELVTLLLRTVQQRFGLHDLAIEDALARSSAAKTRNPSELAVCRAAE